MLSNHYPLAFATDYSWIIAALVFLMGVTIRHYFNTMHRTGKGPHWTWAATVLLFIAISWLSTANMWGRGNAAQAHAPTAYEETFITADGFEDVHTIVLGRCSMCHAREPFWSDTLHWAPKGVVLDTPADIARNARAIYLQAGISHAMPPANVTHITDEERLTLSTWYQNANAY